MNPERLEPSLSNLSAPQWGIVITAAAVLVLVLFINVARRNARRWRALSDIRLDIVADDFLALGDLSRVSNSHAVPCVTHLELAHRYCTSHIGNLQNAD
jgi:hypothetical protein